MQIGRTTSTLLIPLSDVINLWLHTLLWVPAKGSRFVRRFSLCFLVLLVRKWEKSSPLRSLHRSLMGFYWVNKLFSGDLKWFLNNLSPKTEMKNKGFETHITPEPLHILSLPVFSYYQSVAVHFHNRSRAWESVPKSHKILSLYSISSHLYRLLNPFFIYYWSLSFSWSYSQVDVPITPPPSPQVAPAWWTSGTGKVPRPFRPVCFLSRGQPAGWMEATPLTLHLHTAPPPPPPPPPLCSSGCPHPITTSAIRHLAR